MDVYRLGSNFRPDDLIEGFTSKIWTERYSTEGEVVLKTPKIQEVKEAIPEGSYICIQDSDEIIRVESHSISTNQEGVEELSTTGRTFQIFLDDRQIKAEASLPYETLHEYTVQDAIGVVIYDKLVNTSTNDVTGGPFPHDPNEAIPAVITKENIHILKGPRIETPPDLSDLQSTSIWYLQNDQAYKFVMDWLHLGELGLRCHRPITDFEETFVVNTGVSRGIITTPASDEDDKEKILFEIYNGQDRTAEQTDRPPVIFRYDAGHIENPTYLLSKKGFKNYARVLSSDGEMYVWNRDDGYTGPNKDPDAGETEPIGINRFELFVDAGTVDPDVEDSSAWMRQIGKTALKNHNRQVMIDGAISATGPYEFGVDYDLGDLVTVMGKYGVKETMRVSEFVRSEDQSGLRFYPTLIRLDPGE